MTSTQANQKEMNFHCSEESSSATPAGCSPNCSLRPRQQLSSISLSQQPPGLGGLGRSRSRRRPQRDSVVVVWVSAREWAAGGDAPGWLLDLPNRGALFRTRAAASPLSAGFRPRESRP